MKCTKLRCRAQPARSRVQTCCKESRCPISNYFTGFGNELPPKPVPNALPIGQNAPQKAPLGLYTEQLSGSPFTAPRLLNRRTWTYRIRPSVMHKPYERIANGLVRSTPFNEIETTPNQLRWDPLPLPTTPTDFVDGLTTLAGNGDSTMHSGVAIHIYAANKSMTDRFFYSADGELLFVPQLGSIVAPHRTRHPRPRARRDCRHPQRHQVPRRTDRTPKLVATCSKTTGSHLRLPDLGPIGANGLANSRDFLTPHAAFDDRDNGTLSGRREVPWQPLGYRLRPLSARRRRLARQLRSLQIRSPSLQLHQHRQLRSPGPVHLHRSHLTQRNSRHGQLRLRPLPAALDGRRAHLPPTVVSSQLHERVHGPRSKANTTPRPRASFPAAPACTTACPAMALTPKHSSAPPTPN